MPPVEAALQQAILGVLEEAGVRASSAAGYDQAWRRAALHEGVEGDEGVEQPGGYALSPRSTRGATRA